MYHSKVARLSGPLFIVLATLLLRVAVVDAAPVQPCAWHAVSAPNANGNGKLHAIAASS